MTPPGQDREASQASTSDSAETSVGEPLSYLEHFQMRVMQDALAEATGAYWLHRAATLDNAIERAGDHSGLASDDQLYVRRRDLRDAALACRQRAAISGQARETESLDLIVLCLREATA